jgi:threonine aldolase
MNFASDNWSGAAPEVLAAIAAANDGYAPAYGGDRLTERVRQRFAEVFEHEVEIWFTATGTASNSLGLAALSRPGGMVLCSEAAHIHNDEWGATEYHSGGMKLLPLAHHDGLIRAEALRAALERYPEGNRLGPLVALSLTQASEYGTVYPAARVRELAGMAKATGLAVHMDGARFGNAVAATGASPADLTWRAGVDFMSFGGTKNGCIAAEAIVVFEPGRLKDIGAIRQRAGHTFSKSRFIAAQFDAYLENGNWLRRAGNANAMAERLRAGLAERQVRQGWDSEANEVFAVLPKAAIERIRAAGGSMHEQPADMLPADRRPAPDESLVRLVASWATTAGEVDRFMALLEGPTRGM